MVEFEVLLGLYLLLPLDSQSSSSSASGASLLSSYLESPEVSETSMVLDFLESFQIFSEFSIDLIGNQLGGGTFSWVGLSVEEPFWHSPLSWVGQDLVDFLDFLLGQFSGSFVHVDFSQLQDQVGESLADTLDGGEGEHNLVLSFNVGVLDTKNMREFAVWNNG